MNGRWKFVAAYSACAGLADASTGLMLLWKPTLTLSLMGAGAPADGEVFIRYIGAFVLGVGLSYFVGLWPALRRGEWDELRAVWKLTALVRLVVCLFTTSAILAGALGPGWISVPLTDGTLAAVQAAWLLAGRWPGGYRS